MLAPNGSTDVPRHHNPPEVVRLAATLGRAVRHARQERGLKAASLAHDVGITQQAMSQIETGKVLPTLGTLFQLACMMNLPLSHLFRAAEGAMSINVTMQQVRQRRAAEKEGAAA